MKDKICGFYLDSEQEQIVLDKSNHLIIVAGAGSGKTLTIMGKIHYLINYEKICPEQILCISFTRASADNLKNKILEEFALDIPVYTFHKLALEVLKEQGLVYEITPTDTLDNIINEFFSITILKSEIHMKKVLMYFKVNKYRNTKKQYLKFYNDNYCKVEMLMKLISTFLHLFKCNNHSLEDFSLFLNKLNHQVLNFKRKQEQIFLLLSLNIYIIYQKYLVDNNEIDFDDMIIKATEIVKAKGTTKRYQYIIIDEYQDTSYIRFLLIKSILEQTNSKLMVVGDDFQSIYRFTGCDISLFLNFKTYFKDAKIMKIENTYRNSNQLIDVAGSFVMKNYHQIKKKLRSSKDLEKPIKIVYYKNIQEEFLKLVLKIHKETSKPILVLGRNNNDVQMILGNKFRLQGQGKIIYNLNTKISINYLTMHKAKGLEEENVIIINLLDDALGFPCKIKDDKILRFVNKKFDNFPYSEERRLFYVALTRTKNYVYLLVPKIKQSIFVKELLKNKKHITIENNN